MDHEWIREEEVEGEENLHDVGHHVFLRQRCCDQWVLQEGILLSPCNHSVLSEEDVNDSNECYSDAEKLVVVLLVCSDLLDGQNDTDTLVRVD